MERRQFLATAAAVSALPLAGCSALGLETTELRAPETMTDPGETHLLFRHADRRLLVFSVRHLRGYDSATGLIPLELDVWHAEDTHLDSFEVAVRAPAGGSEPATNVFLRTPWYDSGPTLDFHRGDDGKTTILSADGLGLVGDGTLTLELLVEPMDEPETLPVAVSGAFGFSKSGTFGRDYRAEGTTTVEIDGERE